MTEVKSPAEQGDVSSGKDTAEIILGGKKFIIHRLRAGKFYKALKVYMDMIKEVAPEKVKSTVETKNPVERKTPEKGKVKKEKVEEINLKDLITSMFESWPKRMVEFISICCSGVDIKEPLTEEKIKGLAYPEEITKTFSVCLKLNNVLDNLKNFATPIGELGVKVK